MKRLFSDQPKKRLRLQEHDYSSKGRYFVTLCTNGRFCLFGKITNTVMFLNDAGLMVHDVFKNVRDHLEHVETDTFIVMPNHVHAIIILKGTPKPIKRSDAQTLPKIMRSIKNYTTFCYSKGVRDKKYEPYFERLWQRSYHDRIVRNSEELEKIRQYILNNPMKWEQDENNPIHYEEAKFS